MRSRPRSPLRSTPRARGSPPADQLRRRSAHRAEAVERLPNRLFFLYVGIPYGCEIERMLLNLLKTFCKVLFGYAFGCRFFLQSLVPGNLDVSVHEVGW